jgi:hypothetical protein
MSALRADKLIATGCGVGVLLLLAAQEKAWPWLITPSTQPGAAAALPVAGTPPAADRDVPTGCPAEAPAGVPGPGPRSPAKPARPPLALSSVLPDAIAARWAGPLARAVREERIGRCEEVTARGPLHPGSAGPDELPAADWPPPWLAGPWQPVAGGLRPGGPAHAFRHPALGTSLSETGPPRS